MNKITLAKGFGKRKYFFIDYYARNLILRENQCVSTD